MILKYNNFVKESNVMNKSDIISRINDIISNTVDSFIWLYSVSTTDFIYKEDGNEKHIIESVTIDMVSINIYEGHDTYINTYDLEYIDLDIDVLHRILDILTKNI